MTWLAGAGTRIDTASSSPDEVADLVVTAVRARGYGAASATRR
jgi:hypothetical protein